MAACWDCSNAAALVDTVDTADLVHLDAEDVVAPKALPRGGVGQSLLNLRGVVTSFTLVSVHFCLKIHTSEESRRLINPCSCSLALPENIIFL